jgi:chemotaxis protein MotA
MDIATIIGLLMGVALLLGAALAGGAALESFINFPALMIVVGGSLSAVLVSFPLSTVLGMFGIIKKCFTSSLPAVPEVVQQFRELATIARLDGLLAVESRLEEIRYPFLQRGMEMVVSGSEEVELRRDLEIEIACIEQRHANGKRILEGFASAALAFGLIGTLIGLVQMLQSLDDPSRIGVGMATALIATLYGALIAHLICLPMAGKLENRSEEEVLICELMLTGMVAILQGQGPRTVAERLHVFMSASKRPREIPRAQLSTGQVVS